MAKTSAAICLFRRPAGTDHVEVLIVHPGGPFWANKHEGAWSFPKGEYDPEAEDGLAAAMREFAEELGSPAPDGDYVELGEITQRAGKVVRCWAAEGDFEVGALASNEFEMEWPPRSGRRQRFPEVDRAEWQPPTDAARLLNAAQVVFVERLVERLSPS